VLTLVSLKKGRSPAKLVETAPTQRAEQLLKAYVIKEELRRLVAERKALAATHEGTRCEIAA
jgi:hypothetical protein